MHLFGCIILRPIRLPKGFSSLIVAVVHLFGCVILRPIRLPKGFSSLIVAVVYYPHWIKDENDSTRDHLFQSLSQAESLHANFALIAVGDFNCLDIISLKKHFRLKQVVKKPTRKNTIIDPVFTNLHQYYDEPRSFPPSGLSDHNTIPAEARVTESGQNITKLTLKRDTHASRKTELRRQLSVMNWPSLFSSLHSLL